jgi:hypothetical protein
MRVEQGGAYARVSEELLHDWISRRYLRLEKRFFWKWLSTEKLLPVDREVLVIAEAQVDHNKEVTLVVPRSTARMRTTYLLTLLDEPGLLRRMLRKHRQWTAGVVTGCGGGFFALSTLRVRGGGTWRECGLYAACGLAAWYGFTVWQEEERFRQKHQIRVVSVPKNSNERPSTLKRAVSDEDGYYSPSSDHPRSS